MENLGIDPKLLVAQLINFVLFFVVFRKFLAKPFSNFINEEKKKDEEREKLYAKAKSSEEKLVEREKALRSQWKKEEDKVLAEVKKNADKLRQDILEEARIEAKAIKEQAQKQLQVEQDEIVKEAKEKIAKLSVYIVNNALNDTLTDDIKRKVTDKILKGQGKEINFYEN